MKDKIIELEKVLDKKVKELTIWQLSFQSIYSALLFTAERIDLNRDTITAMDYLGRISLIYPLIKQYAQKSEVETTTQAITQSVLKIGQQEFLEDIQFLNAYAHFCMLMPQVYRKTLVVESVNEKYFKLNFRNDTVRDSELIDKLYSTISMPLSMSYPGQKNLKAFTDFKASKRNSILNKYDFIWIEKIYKHHLRYSVGVEVLTNEILESNMGFNYDDFSIFIAILKAFSDYLITLSRSFQAQEEDKSLLRSEYIEFSTCCLNCKFLGHLIEICGLTSSKFYLIISYFLDVYSNRSEIELVSNSYCGEGFQPPITLIDGYIIFSPHALRYFLSFNNILFSINKNNRNLFDNKISHNLEPVLINQLEYIFSSFNNLELKKNINYSESEIDLMVLSKIEKLCLCIQVKTTIAPDSSRAVARVQDRIIEALKQINKFEAIGSENQTKLINETFKTTLESIKVINLIVVRSCAGSDRGWKVNDKYKILNYSILAKILCDKLRTRNLEFWDFETEVLKEQQDIIQNSNWGVDSEKLKINEYEIEFPNIHFDDNKVVYFDLGIFEFYPKWEKALPESVV